MASGTITGSTSKWTRVDVSWSSTKGNGGSLVSATVKIIHTARYNYNATKSCSITINGATKSSSTLECGAISSAGTYTAISGAAWVPYTGDKSITITGTVNLSGVSSSAGGNLGNRTTSATVALDKIGSIPSMPSFNSPATGIISETGGTINVGWSKSTSYNGSGNYDLQVSINGGNWTSVSRDIGINTTSYSYKYDAGQGNSYRFAVQCINDIGGSGFAFSNTVTTNSLSAPTIGDIDVYNPYLTSTLTVPLSDGGQTNGSSIARMCALYFDDTYITETTYDSKSLDNKSQSITYAAADYASKIGPTAYSSDKFKIVAWTQNSNGTKSNYVTKYFTVNLNTDGGAVPTLNAPTLSGGAFDYPSTCFLAGVTSLTVSSPNATLQRAPSGTTVSYSIACTGMTTSNNQTANFYGLSPGSKTIKVTATDSRGLSATATTTCMVQSYSLPSIKNVTGGRLDDPATTAKVIYTVTYSPVYANGISGDDLNTITSQEYKINDGNWASYTSDTEITNLNTELAYTIYIRVKDKVNANTYSTASIMIPTIKSALSLRRTGIGIGVIPKNGYALDVGGKARFESDVCYVVENRERTPITMIAGNDRGDGVKLEATGLMAIGCFKSATEFLAGRKNQSGQYPVTFITSNSGVQVVTNIGRGYASRYEFNMTGDGVLDIPGDLDMKLSKHINLPCTGGKWVLGERSDWTSFSLLYYKETDGKYSDEPTKGYYFSPNSNGGDSVLTLDMAFPVGAVYITYNNNNPSNFLGGTWVQFGQGRTLMGVGSYTDSMNVTGEYTEGSFGGTYNPVTKIGVTGNAYRGIGAADSYKSRILVVDGDMENTDTYIKHLDLYGYDKMTPYITVYFWRRTA